MVESQLKGKLATGPTSLRRGNPITQRDARHIGRLQLERARILHGAPHGTQWSDCSTRSSPPPSALRPPAARPHRPTHTRDEGSASGMTHALGTECTFHANPWEGLFCARWSACRARVRVQCGAGERGDGGYPLELSALNKGGISRGRRGDYPPLWHTQASPMPARSATWSFDTPRW